MLMRKLGRTGLKVSALCLGGNTFGWTTDQKASEAVLDAYVEAGGNFIDTADVYSRWAPGNKGGESETALGIWMTARKNRHSVLMATKVMGPMGPGPNDTGLSRQHIMEGVEASLAGSRPTTSISTRRTGTIATRPSRRRCAPSTTSCARARCATSAPPTTWRGGSRRALWESDKRGFARYESLQPKNNLVFREPRSSEQLDPEDVHRLMTRALRADARRGPPLRGHGQPVPRRRHHGAVRRARSPTRTTRGAPCTRRSAFARRCERWRRRAAPRRRASASASARDSTPGSSWSAASAAICAWTTRRSATPPTSPRGCSRRRSPGPSSSRRRRIGSSQGYFDVRSIGALALKGKAEGGQCVGGHLGPRLADASGGRGRAGLTPLVGRDREVRPPAGVLRARRGQGGGQIVFVVGEPGIGQVASCSTSSAAGPGPRHRVAGRALPGRFRRAMPLSIRSSTCSGAGSGSRRGLRSRRWSPGSRGARSGRLGDVLRVRFLPYLQVPAVGGSRGRRPSPLPEPRRAARGAVRRAPPPPCPRGRAAIPDPDYRGPALDRQRERAVPGRTLVDSVPAARRCSCSPIGRDTRIPSAIGATLPASSRRRCRPTTARGWRRRDPRRRRPAGRAARRSSPRRPRATRSIVEELVKSLAAGSTGPAGDRSDIPSTIRT